MKRTRCPYCEDMPDAAKEIKRLYDKTIGNGAGWEHFASKVFGFVHHFDKHAGELEVCPGHQHTNAMLFKEAEEQMRRMAQRLETTI